MDGCVWGLKTLYLDPASPSLYHLSERLMKGRATMMKLIFRTILLPLISGFFALSAFAESVIVHKTPWCGCCAHWVEHLREDGFDVTVEETEDLASVRETLGVPDQIQSCHTAQVEGYVLEGHVPAAEVRRLLAERPEATGLAVPGMPMGSPGMETRFEPDVYDVLLFDSVRASRYATYHGGERVNTD